MSRKGIQLAVPFEEKRLARWNPPYIVQPKLDGERCRAVPLNNNQYMLLSSEENPFFSVPHITNLLSSLNLKIELDGELYCHGMNFEQIHSIVSRTVNIHPDYKLIKYHIFDYVSNESQIVRLHNLVNNLLIRHNYISLIPHCICDSLEDIMRAYDLFLNKGYEGIIVRHLQAPYLRKRSIYMMKWKPKKEDIYEIVGFKEEVDKGGNPKDRLGAIICRGNDETEFSVGSGLKDEDRESLWNVREELRGKKLKVEYQHLTAGKKVPRFPVFVEVVE